MQRLVNEYEAQYHELVNRRKQQSEEMKLLRKDNVNMHKEHNRLQFVIKECCKEEEMHKAKISRIVATKDENIDELNTKVKNLSDKINEKDEEIAFMRKTIETNESEISKYHDIFKEIGHESNALIEALANELGVEEESQPLDFNAEGNGELILSAMKKRRCSLRDDFKIFSKHELNPAWTIKDNAKNETERSSQATDARIEELQTHLQDNFQEMTDGCEKTLSDVRQTEKGVKNIQQCAVRLQNTLLEPDAKEENNEKLFQGARCDKVDLERQLQELKKKYDEIVQENRKINEDRIKWMNESERKTKDYLDLKDQVFLNEKIPASAECEKNIREGEDRHGIEAPYPEKTRPSEQLHTLKTDTKKRFENGCCVKTQMEIQPLELKEKYPHTERKLSDFDLEYSSSVLTEDQNQEGTIHEQVGKKFTGTGDQTFFNGIASKQAERMILRTCQETENDKQRNMENYRNEQHQQRGLQTEATTSELPRKHPDVSANVK